MQHLTLRGQQLVVPAPPPPSPALDLDFTTGVLDSRLTFTRASSATYFDSSGTLLTAPGNTPRFDYNPATRQALGLLIEEQRQNITYPSVNWKAAVTPSATADGVVQNAGIAPDGTGSAMNLVPGTMNVAAHQYYVTFSGVASTTYTFSVFVKSNGYSGVWISLGNNGFGSQSASVSVDLLSGTIVSLWSNTTAGITSCGNGWWRIAVTGTTPSTATAPWVAAIRIFPDGGSANLFSTPFSGDGSSGVLAWGQQIEVGTFVTSYIPTTTSSVTRAADSCAMDVSTLLNANAGTLATDFILEGRGGTYGGPLSIVGSNAATDWISPTSFAGTPATYPVTYTGGSVFVANVGGNSGNPNPPPTLAIGGRVQAAMNWLIGATPLQSYNQNLNVPVSGSSALASTPSVSTLQICGTYHYQNGPSGWTRRARLWRASLSAQQLVRITSA